MSKLSLNPSPTFKCPVPIPVPGKGVVEIVFIFNHMSKPKLQEFAEGVAQKTDAEGVMEVACGWEDIDQPFSRGAVDVLLENFHGAAKAIFNTFIDELRGARIKNL